MYKAPLELFVTDIDMYIDELNSNVDQYVYEVTRSYGVNVDKDELVKALNYDRKQYEKGYHDAKEEHDEQLRKIAEKLVGADCYELGIDRECKSKSYSCSECYYKWLKGLVE